MKGIGRLAAVLLAGVLAGCASNGAAERTGLDALLAIDQLAGEAYAAGRHAEVVELYTTLAEAMPSEPTYWYRLANGLYRTGQLDMAGVAYVQALALDPDNERAWHNLGLVRMHQAQESFRQAVAASRAGEPVSAESLRLARRLSLAIEGAADEGRPGSAPVHADSD